MGTEVKFFHSDMVGAPVLSGTAGALIAVLDACLKDGFNSKTLDSLVIAGGVATATVSGGHNFLDKTVLLLAGATPTGLNGEKRITVPSNTVFTFDATGISDQTATGTITAKMAPLGWTKPFSGTNLAAYKPSDVTATGMLLRVNDTTTLSARVNGYETMSDVNTGTGQFPTTAQLNGGWYWNKSYQANATARQWVIFGDSRAFYFCSAPQTAASFVTHFFGDILAYKSGDAYSCALSGTTAESVNITANLIYECMGATTAGTAVSHYLPRLYTALGSAVSAVKFSAAHWIDTSTSAYSGAAAAIVAARPLTYPNGADNSLIFAKVLSWGSNALRGVFPGVYHSPQNCASFYAYKDLIAGTGDLVGKTVMAIPVGNSNKGIYGLCFFDITGPWR